MGKWGYADNNGPRTWSKNFPIAKGDKQSPIDIVTTAAVFDYTLNTPAPLTTFYWKETDLNILNNGHSVQASIKRDSGLTGGPLKDKYKLEQFHLHWGSENDHGSEHTIDGQTFASELHLVHWNTKYESFGEAADKPDGLAVLGVMIKSGKENLAFKDIANNLCNVSKSGSECTIKGTFDPSTLLPGNKSCYWTYDGSLTTPPLYESVTWIIFRDPVQFSPKQLQCLRSMQNDERKVLQDNYRPPNPLNSRKVARSFKILEEKEEIKILINQPMLFYQ